MKSASFHPRGERGLQPFVRGASYRSYPTAEFLQEANDETVVVLHIEGTEGVKAFDQIADVDGVDVAFVGPYDLSQSLGISRPSTESAGEGKDAGDPRQGGTEEDGRRHVLR